MADCGFYGKLPSEGDFVTRRLPWEFTSAWDDWLQQGLQASRAALGERWLAQYLSAPVWRFQIAPGVCGPQGWIGLFFASVDRVGRYFPLTVATPDPVGVPSLATLSGDEARWMACEDAALAALDPRLAIEDFDLAVQAIALPPPAAVVADPASRPRACLFTPATDTAPAIALGLPDLPEAAGFVELIAVPASSAGAG